ncbi:BglG family transcription antiterminator LicT [Bacillus altitudinis]|uniref:Transcriptional antiterminator (BglG family) n=2 Tax=Bacillus TaxID=1386 RepID=A0A653XY18_BACAB|nr:MULTISPECIES: PRD domain-containing protein [Bacillus]KQL42974.1 transcription antiterminator LicT [Bacillus sp. FJAT-21955]MBY0185218.1 PRD domain-containing protein [Bacillus aerophilus]WOQ73701.1 PRD domain-containing protein [Bacillus stratosphericus]AKC67881.1 transcription antiterminator LicT [Bacillus altitudinis]AMB91546.1 transcription antiterminator LicT [Bacillus altitudinis]
MIISKVINNNVVSAYDDEQHELVIMGRGIAFQKKSGDPIDEERIEKVFSIQNKDISEKFKTLLYDIPIEYMQVCEAIIDHARTTLNKNLNDSIYVTLTDHITFAIERHQKGMDIKNALLWEIKRLYKEEFMCGVEAIRIIQDKLNIHLPEDEAGFIAMHIVNAELNEEMPNVIQITKLIQDILNIVKYHFQIDLDEESLNYFRFVTHLKFFGQRLFNETQMENQNEFLYEVVKEKNTAAFQCAEKINDYVQKEYNRSLIEDEMLYLTLHIDRVIKRK